MQSNKICYVAHKMFLVTLSSRIISSMTLAMVAVLVEATSVVQLSNVDMIKVSLVKTTEKSCREFV